MAQRLNTQYHGKYTYGIYYKDKLITMVCANFENSAIKKAIFIIDAIKYPPLLMNENDYSMMKLQ